MRLTHWQRVRERLVRTDRASARIMHGNHTPSGRALLLCAGAALMVIACGPPPRTDAAGLPLPPGAAGPEKVRPGISVLLSDSIHLIKDKRVGLITNQTGIDEKGRSSVDLLHSDERATKANVKLTALFSPEHGIRGTEDRSNLPNEVDPKTGLVIHSLYQRSTIGPPDSTLKDVDVLLVDLQDIGTRTWTYVGVMLYAMQVGDRLGKTVLVLDRPNPITGLRAEGALLDSALADARESTGSMPKNGFALWPVPLRHGLTMGELALLFHRELELKGRMQVIKMAGWRRDMWFDDTDLPWVKPSPNLPTLTSALLYPALVPFEATNVSVGRGTNEPFQQVGAPWLKADSVRKLLETLELPAVRFSSARFTPLNPGDNKYGGQAIPGIRIQVLDRDRVLVARIGAALIWAIAKVHGPDFTYTPRRMDERLGSSAMREALIAGEDPDRIVDRLLPSILGYERDVKQYHLYR